MYKKCIKRVLSISISLTVLLCMGWLMLIVVIWLHYANKGAGVFFKQERPGKEGKLFKVFKFKTMTDEKGPDGELLPDDARLTKIGRFVRSTSIDELPQLFNVLRGDMALIGPRPLKVEYLELYTPEQNRRHEVKPGITGWAQVHGRNELSFTERFKYDVYYVDHLTFCLDVRISYLTILKIFKREGISAQGQATVETFNGNN